MIKLIAIIIVLMSNILVIGDSQAGFVAKVVNDNVTVRYKGGTTIKAWNNYYINSVKPGDASYIIIFLGSNDYWKKDISNISNIIRFVGDRSCLWVGPPKMYGKSHEFNIRLKEYVESNSNCRYFDSESIDIELSDEVHPTSNGARDWWMAIIKYLAKNSF